MSATRIRRKVYELTPSDLNRYAVWEFAHDEEGTAGQDEATVRPYVTNGPVDAAEGASIVRASLKLADGTRLKGYISRPLQGKTGLGTVQPVAVVSGGQIPFWYGRFVPSPERISKCYALLGKNAPGDVFPLTFECDVALGGGSAAGEVLGFMVIEDLKSRRVKVIV